MNCLTHCASALLALSLGWGASAQADCQSAWPLGANANDKWGASCIDTILSIALQREVADDFDFTGVDRGALGAPRVARAQFDAQAWFRDPPAPRSTNLSDAVHFVLAP